MSDFIGRYDQTYSAYRKVNASKCTFDECENTAVYLSGSMRLCVDHYMKLKV